MIEEHPPHHSALLAHRPYLERLALHLTGERSNAEDLVQETLLMAIERPPRHDANLQAWLQRVIRRLHYRRKRRDALRRATDLDPALHASEDGADETIASSEMSRHVAERVQALDEPYRRVVLLRFYEDKAPMQIAAELGRPLTTITSQLARARQRLRAQLERQHDGERVRRSHVLVALMQWSAREKLRALRRRLSEVRGSASFRMALSAGVMLSPCLAAVVLTILRSEWRSPSAGLAAAAGRGAPLAGRMRASDGIELPSRREPAAVAAQPDPSAALAAALPPETWVEVVNDSGAPIADALVYLTRGPVPIEDGDLATLEGGELQVWSGEQRTDSRGRVRLDLRAENAVPVAPSGQVGLVVEGPGYVRSYAHYVLYPPRSSETIRVSLQRPAFTVRGSVIDPEGAPAQALIFVGSAVPEWLVEDDRLVIPHSMGRPTDREGHFELDGLASCTQRILIWSQGCLLLEDWVDEAHATDRVFVLRRGATVRGRVVTKDGQPVAGARISAESTSVLSDADGAFELTGIGCGLVWVSAEHPSDPLLTDSAAFEITGSEELEWLPELNRRPPLRMRVVTDDGRPLARACVKVCPDPGNNLGRLVIADDEGIASIAGLPVRSYLADVFRSQGEEACNCTPCVAGLPLVLGEQENTLVVPRARLEHGTFKGRVIAGEDQKRLAMVFVRPVEGKAASFLDVNRSTGIFQRELVAQRYVVVLFLENLGVVPLGEREVRADETCDLGPILVPAAATLEVDWRWDEGRHYDYKLIQQATNGGWSVPYGWVIWQGQGPFSGELPALPGSYEWSIWKQGKQIESQLLDVRSNATVSVVTGPATRRSER